MFSKTNNSSKTWVNIVISLFVVFWLGVYHYVSLRHFYLEEWFDRSLPKVKWLFPPAGWIMFYRVDDIFGFTEVYGVKDEQLQRIDPHEIFRTRTIGYDNIHRGIMGNVANKKKGPMFCGYLKRKFPYFDQFVVISYYYPSITKEPHDRLQQVQYRCVE